MQPEDIGEQGENEVSRILFEAGCSIRRDDRLIILPNDDLCFLEVKNKEPWEPPPDYMQGIHESQYRNYMKFYEKKNIRTLVFVRGINKEWLANWLDNLRPDVYRQLKDGKEYVFFKLSKFIPYKRLSLVR